MSANGISRLAGAAIAATAVASVAALAGVTLVADAEREAAADARAADAAAIAARELELAVADLERGARGFVITGRERFLEPYRRAQAEIAGADTRIDAYVRERLEPLIALARRDRREARIAVARGGGQSHADELRAELDAAADRRSAAAAAAADRAEARADALPLVAAGGAAAVLLLALLAGLLMRGAIRRAADAVGQESSALLAAAARESRRATSAALAAERRSAAYEAIAAVVVEGGGPDAVLRAYADAVEADLGALYTREGEGPFRLVAVRGLDARELGDELRLDEGLAGRAASELRPVTGRYDDATLTVRAHGRDVAVRHELHLPLTLRGHVVGVVTLARVSPVRFADPDVALAEALAAQAASALYGLTQAPAPRPPVREVDLVRLTRESVEAARAEAEERGVEVSLALEGVPRCAGDPDRISLALDELVSRAMAAAAPGGRVDARLFPRGGSAVVELVVEPGGQPGLDLARAVFEDHGGAVRVEGPGGGRTAFRVELPLRAFDHA